MIAASIGLGLLFLCAYMCAIIGLRSFARWSVRREEARHHAATFECDFIPHPGEIAPAESHTDALLDQVRADAALEAAERVVDQEAMCIDLDAAIAHIEGLRQ